MVAEIFQLVGWLWKRVDVNKIIRCFLKDNYKNEKNLTHYIYKIESDSIIFITNIGINYDLGREISAIKSSVNYRLEKCNRRFRKQVPRI